METVFQTAGTRGLTQAAGHLLEQAVLQTASTSGSVSGGEPAVIGGTKSGQSLASGL